jgi:phosphoethanolamine N-methyltransferase
MNLISFSCGGKMTSDIQYPDNFIERLHAVWGEGFLSPGGPEEVHEIVRDLDLAGKTLLDIGFGTAGPAITLARELGAGLVVGIDVEEPLHRHAKAMVDAAGLSDRVDLRLVKPGPLPFEDASFDVVFSKDSIIHIPDKDALFAEIRRVLKPGGIFAASDWLSGEGPDAEAALKHMGGHLHFEMATAPQMEKKLRDAGFENVKSVDRNAWYAIVVEEELRTLERVYEDLVAKVGKEIVDPWLQVRRGAAKAVQGGGLRPTHLRSTKP